MKYFVFFCFLSIAIKTNAQLSDFTDVNFKKSDSIALLYKNSKLTNLPKLAYQLTHKLPSDIEKFRAIYIWVCSNISNDYKMFQKNKRKRNKYKNDETKLKKWNKELSKKMFHQLLSENKTVCTGYAYLIKELSILANLQCEIIDGFGRLSTTNIESLKKPNHSWNAIKLNEKWYLCDATWSSGQTNLSNNEFVFKYNNGYFLTDPEVFIKNHYPSNKKWMLIKNVNLTFKEFKTFPLLYSNAFKYISNVSFPDKMKAIIKKNEKIIFKYQLLDANIPVDISLLINTSFKSKSTKPSSIIQDKNMLFFEFSFEKKGFYDLHIMFSKDIISTYTFSVK